MTETVRNESVEYETKICPRCGAKLYADMNVCYGCLYDFSRNASTIPVLTPEQLVTCTLCPVVL